MTLRIACDLDGTLADMDGALQREAERLIGPDVTVRRAGAPHVQVPLDDTEPDASRHEDPSPGKKPLTSTQMRRLWDHVSRIDNFWTTLKEIEPGAVARLATLRLQHEWDVIFLTQRPDTAGGITQLQSQRWLQAHGFELPSVYVVNGSRGTIAAALGLDAVIDDRPENCLDVVTDSSARPILVWRDSPDTVPQGATRFGIDVVFSAREAFERLEQMTMHPDARTPVTRMRRAIGI
jgi:hypothetical protein